MSELITNLKELMRNWFPLKSELSEVATSGDYEHLQNRPIVDDALNEASTNAIQNKAVKTALDNKVSLTEFNEFKQNLIDSDWDEFIDALTTEINKSD